MKYVYVLINNKDFEEVVEVVGVYSTLDRAIMEGRRYYENNIFDNSKIVAVPHEWEDSIWLLFEVYGEKEYDRKLWGYIQRYEVKE